jgi:hypothetical protein
MLFIKKYITETIPSVAAQLEKTKQRNLAPGRSRYAQVQHYQ